MLAPKLIHATFLTPMLRKNLPKKLIGFNIRLKAEEVSYKAYRDQLEIAKRADNAYDRGLYFLAIPEFFARRERNRLHSMNYMGGIATVTEHAKFGPNVLVVPLFHPKHVADMGASLDIMSNGRFVLGVGVGFWPSEYENFSVPWEKRGEILDESLDIITKFWTQPSIEEYKGKFFTVKNEVSPPPVQKPHPPIWMGGDADAVLRRTAKYGDEWAPSWWFQGETLKNDNTGPKTTGIDFKERLDKLSGYCKKYGRELVLGRPPRTPKEVGFNISGLNFNINPDREKAIDEARHFWLDVRGGRTQGGGDFEMKMKFAGVGKPEALIEKLEQAYKLGAYGVTVYPLGTDAKRQWDMLEKDVLPSL